MFKRGTFQKQVLFDGDSNFGPDEMRGSQHMRDGAFDFGVSLLPHSQKIFRERKTTRRERKRVSHNPRKESFRRNGSKRKALRRGGGECRPDRWAIYGAKQEV